VAPLICNQHANAFAYGLFAQPPEIVSFARGEGEWSSLMLELIGAFQTGQLTENRWAKSMGQIDGPNLSKSPYHRDPAETVRSCMVMPRASFRHRKAASSPISSGWIMRCCGLSALVSAI
jgi:hypothetical protein